MRFSKSISAGVLSDKVKNRRLLLAASSIILGFSCGFLPLFSENRVWIDSLLFLVGAASAFFVPLLASLALSLAGRRNMDLLMGENQGWNHAGNITAALLALVLVKVFGIESIFFAVASISFLAAGSPSAHRTPTPLSPW